MPKLMEWLCGISTRHRFALGLAVWPDRNGPGNHQYYCLCRFCHKQFWTERKPRNMMEDPHE